MSSERDLSYSNTRAREAGEPVESKLGEFWRSRETGLPATGPKRAAFYLPCLSMSHFATSSGEGNQSGIGWASALAGV